MSEEELQKEIEKVLSTFKPEEIFSIKELDNGLYEVNSGEYKLLCGKGFIDDLNKALGELGETRT